MSRALTPRQRQALELIDRERNPVSSRRLAGEYGLRSQDAGRTLESLFRRGDVELVTYPLFGYQRAADRHVRTTRTELGHARAVCAACGTDWPCPTVGQARDEAARS